jgi:sugar lactone lactonase YvrE
MKKLSSAFLLPLFLCNLAIASVPTVWSVNSRAEIMKGDARGVSIDDSGTITLAPKLTEVFRTDQPYIWSSAVDAAGNIYLGTGADGKVFKVDASGKGSLFSDLAELNVTAIAIGKSGEVFAATSPDGKVYRLDAGGAASVYFDPKQKYIWSLAMMPDGSLAVGTGDSGRIYRVRSANAAPDASLLFDTSETNITSLAVDRSGNLYAGTDPNGLVIRFGSDGKPFGVLDSSLREVHELSVGNDGTVYALALSEAAGTAKPSDTTAASSDKPVSADKSTQAAESTSKSKYDLTGVKSAVYRILPDGGSDVIWTSASPAFSLMAQQTGVLIGSSDKGRIYSVANDARETLLLQSDASQISTLRTVGQNLIATSSNQGVLYRVGFDSSTEGSYESSVLDAKSAASWGRIWWRSSGNVQIQTRSGNTAKPDETWSAWTAPTTTGSSEQVASPKARFLQWRAVLKNAGARANLSEVNVAFVARNIAPEVLSISALPTNVGLVPNPAPQIDPNIELSGLDPAAFGIPSSSVPPRRVYQRAAKSFQWTADDRNGDKLVYDVLYKEVSETNWRILKQNIDDTFFTLDGQSLADGQYVFKVVAKDTPSNPAGLALSGERSTDPINIDNTPPTVAAANGGQDRVVFTASDRSSYLVRAEYSINGGEWKTVYADDGISDSPNETYTVAVPAVPGEYAITLRVFDVEGNAGNARQVVRR